METDSRTWTEPSSGLVYEVRLRRVGDSSVIEFVPDLTTRPTLSTAVDWASLDVSDETLGEVFEQAAIEAIASAEESYTPLEPFHAWADLPVDETTWEERRRSLLSKKDHAKDPQWFEALERVATVAAVETGAIESLYDLPRGYTLNLFNLSFVVTGQFFADKSQRQQNLIDDQLAVYANLTDLVTDSTPVAEASIRELHRSLCKSQDTYTVQLPDGRSQEQQLPKGEYKGTPNHVLTARGELHAYAPVSDTPPEMSIFVAQLRTEAFRAAHPALKAAYAHYGLVRIHPFADGNGRVARALASVFLMREGLVPLLIFADQTGEYFAALADADQGHRQKFVDFVYHRALAAMELTEQALEVGELPGIGVLTKRLRFVYETTGGYSHEELDLAAARLLDIFGQGLHRLGEEAAAQEPKLSYKYGKTTDEWPVKDGRRGPVSAGRLTGWNVVLVTDAPAAAEVKRRYRAEIPVDYGVNDRIVITREGPTGQFPRVVVQASAAELHPNVSANARAAAELGATRQIKELLLTVSHEAAKALIKGPYGVSVSGRD